MDNHISTIFEPIVKVRLQYRRAEGEPLIDCGELEMIDEETN